MSKIAIDVCGDIHVLSHLTLLDDLIDMGVEFTLIGCVCPNACDTSCLHYRTGKCPYRTMKDIDGRFIHMPPNNEERTKQ